MCGLVISSPTVEYPVPIPILKHVIDLRGIPVQQQPLSVNPAHKAVDTKEALKLRPKGLDEEYPLGTMNLSPGLMPGSSEATTPVTQGGIESNSIVSASKAVSEPVPEVVPVSSHEIEREYKDAFDRTAKQLTSRANSGSSTSPSCSAESSALSKCLDSSGEFKYGGCRHEISQLKRCLYPVVERYAKVEADRF